MSKRETILKLRQEEIQAIKKDLGISKSGLLKAEQIVKEAKKKKEYPSLYSYFQWDNTKAAHEYRLWQARELIVKVRITTVEGYDIQAHISLKSDRESSGGGYRETVAVMSNKSRREELLKQAWEDFESWRLKYELLKELAPVFVAAEKAKAVKRASVKRGVLLPKVVKCYKKSKKKRPPKIEVKKGL